MKTFNKFSSLRSEQSQISEAQFSKQDLEDMANLEESEISKNNLEPVQALSYPQDNPPQQNNQSHEGHQHGPNCVHSHSEHEHTSECFKSSKEDKISKDTLLAELNKLSVARIKNYLLLGLFAVDQETKNHVCYSCTQEISSRFSFLKAPTQIESFQDNLYGFEDICNTVMNNSIESQLREIFETSLKDSQVDLKDPLSLTQQEVQKIRTVYTKALLKKFSACLKSVNCSCGAPLFVPLLSTSQTFITRENFEVSVAPKAYEQLFLKLKGLINYSITNSFFENLKNPALQNNLPSQDIFYKSALINKELFLQKKGPQFVLRGTFLGLTENCDLIEYLSSNEAQMENLALSKALSNSFKQHLQINQDQTKTLSESKVFVQDGRDLSYTDIDFLKLKDYKSFLNLDIDGTSTNAPNFGSTKLDFLLFKFLAFLQKKKLVKLIINSGRPIEWIFMFMLDLGLSPLCISGSGTAIVYPRIPYDLVSKSKYYWGRAKGLIEKLKQVLELIKLKYSFFDFYEYFNPITCTAEEIFLEVFSKKISMGPLGYLIGLPTCKVLEKILETDVQVASLVKQNGLGSLTFTASDSGKIHVSSSKYTKEDSLSKLVSAALIDEDKLFIVGNNYNDLPLTRRFKNTYAVSNAVPAFKQNCNTVLKNGYSKGVIEAVKNYLFSKNILDDNSWKDLCTQFLKNQEPGYMCFKKDFLQGL